MDIDTLIIMGLFFAAFSWWMIINVNEKRALVKQCLKDEEDRLGRAERVRQLSGK